MYQLLNNFWNYLKIRADHTLPLDCTVFEKYSLRVKHIRNRKSLRIHPNVAAFLPHIWSGRHLIPNLVTTQISIPRCDPAVIPLNISPNLIHLDIDLGFKKQPPDNDTIMHQFLDQVLHGCPRLSHVGFRGFATQHINKTISAMRNLESLSLRIGNSLSEETLHTVMGFAHLLELEVHAGNITLPNPLQEDHFQSHGTFASLQKLCIRASSSTVEGILNYVRPNTLRHLQIDLDDISSSNMLWSTIFKRIGSKGSKSLLHLSLEHHFETLDLPSSLAPSAAIPGQHGPTTANSSIFCEAFRALASLKHLRHFSCDLTVPPIIFDQDFEKIIESWPDLEHLELGPIPDILEEDFHSHLTPGILAFAATMAPKLERLVFPLIIGDELPAIFPLKQTYLSNQLHNITVARLNTSRAVKVGDFLHHLFPSLDIIEGPSDDIYPWSDVNAALRELRNHTPGTSTD